MKIDFLCVGFAKCGTTTVDELLRQHKDIMLPIVKETSFYERKELYNRGLKWYEKRYFGTIGSTNKKIGEVNPRLTGSFFAKKIKKNLGKDVKFIFIIRNPVDRLFSHFKMNLLYGRGIYHDKFDINIPCELIFRENTINSIKYIGEKGKARLCKYWEEASLGKYSLFISNFLKYYPIENIKFLIFEDFIKDQEKYCKEIFDFLQVDRNVDIDYDIKENGGNKKWKTEICGKIFKFLDKCLWDGIIPYGNFKNTPKMMQIYYKIEDKLLIKDNSKHKIDDETRKILEDYYRPDKEKLEKILGRDLSGLWFK